MITTNEDEDLEALLLYVDQDEGPSYGSLEHRPITNDQRMRFNSLVDDLGLRKKLPRHWFNLDSYDHAQKKIKALKENYLPSPRQMRLAAVLCRKAGIRLPPTRMKNMSRKQLERVIAEANNSLRTREQVQDSLETRKNLPDVLRQHESFRSRYKPSQPFSVSDHDWNTWLNQKPDSIVGWDEWVSRKPLGTFS